MKKIIKGNLRSLRENISILSNKKLFFTFATKINQNTLNSKYTNSISDHLRFPTFEFENIEKELDYGFHQDRLKLDFDGCIMELDEFCLLYDKLLLEHPNHKYIQDCLRESKMNHISYKIFALLLKRHVNLMNNILGWANKESISHSSKVESIFQIDKEKIINELIEINKHYFNKDDTIAKLEIAKLIENHINIENNLVEFHYMNQEYSPSIYSIHLTVKVLKVLLSEIISEMKELDKMAVMNNNFEGKMINFFHSCSKMETLSNIFLLAYKIPSSEIFNSSEDSWKELSKHIERYEPVKKEVIKQRLEQVIRAVAISQAAMSKASEFKGKYSRIFARNWFFIYYLFNHRKAKTQAAKFMINPSFEVAREVWSLIDKRGIIDIIKLGFPKVKYSKYWYLKKIEEKITLDLIDKLLNNNLDNNDSGLNKNYPVSELIKSKVSPEEISEYVKVKIINHEKIKIAGETKSSQTNSAIIHFHGGGFIALTPTSHENHTRKWANTLKVPIFSVDYRLAREYPYPSALDDIYQAYMWVLNYSETVLGMKLDNIILVGDSAGGNFVASLTNLLILLKKKLPTAIFLVYPGLRVNLDHFTGSALNVINDALIPYTILKFCVSSYLSDYRNDSDPLLSPLIADEQILKQLPPVRIFCGSSDPLRDDSVLYLHKLVELKKDAKMIEFKYFPHGFLQYDSPYVMPEASFTNDKIMEEFSNFINKKLLNITINP